MTIYLHDGVEFDLDCEFVDVTGVIWSWTGGWSPAGEPMLRSDASGPDLPLPDAYYYHGPLIPRRRPDQGRSRRGVRRHGGRRVRRGCRGVRRPDRGPAVTPRRLAWLTAATGASLLLLALGHHIQTGGH
jgi:hypothetical protein